MALEDVTPGTGDGESIGNASEWADRVEQLLYQGETVETTVDLGDEDRVVVTSHRVLAFRPSLDGANFREVARPNVAGVSRGSQSNTWLMETGLKAGILGLVGLGAGLLVDVGGLIGDASVGETEAAGQLGVGGIMGFAQTVIDLLRLLPLVLLVGGGLGLAAGILLLGLWVRDRDPTLAIDVAGGEPLHVPRPPDSDPARRRLERAVAATGDGDPDRADEAPPAPGTDP